MFKYLSMYIQVLPMAQLLQKHESLINFLKSIVGM